MPLDDPQSTDFPWQQAIAQHGRRVLVALLARGLALPDAEELAQETWTRLIARRARGQLDRVDLPGLAVRQALFLLGDARKEQRRDGAVSLALASEQEGADLERTVAARHDLERARRTLEQLSPRARETFTFVYTHPEVRHEEAAASLGMSTQRLRQTLYEIRQRLRAQLLDIP